MIYIQSKYFEEGICLAQKKLIRLKHKSDDPKLDLEESAVIIIRTPNKIKVNKNSTKYKKEYKYFSILFNEHVIKKIINKLIKTPNSRRILFNFWNNKTDFSENLNSTCLTHIYFRKQQNKLNMHTHMRATESQYLLPIDIYFCNQLHNQICKLSRIPIGIYTHSIDSFHTYKPGVF